jgi:hypothetical protein
MGANAVSPAVKSAAIVSRLPHLAQFVRMLPSLVAFEPKLNHDRVILVVTCKSTFRRRFVGLAPSLCVMRKAVTTDSLIGVNPCGKPHLRIFPALLFGQFFPFMPDFDC